MTFLWYVRKDAEDELLLKSCLSFYFSLMIVFNSTSQVIYVSSTSPRLFVFKLKKKSLMTQALPLVCVLADSDSQQHVSNLGRTHVERSRDSLFLSNPLRRSLDDACYSPYFALLSRYAILLCFHIVLNVD